MRTPTPTAPPAATSIRALAFTAGAIILAAATYAAVAKSNMDSATALLTYAIAGGVLAGSVIVGRAFAAGLTKIGLGITAAIICGEAYTAWLTGERVIAQREVAQVQYRKLAGANSYAHDKLTAAHVKLEAAETTLKAARATAQQQGVLASCKAVCKANNEAAVTGAEKDRDTARKDYDDAARTYDANEKPQPVITLADKIGLAPWIADVGLAVLLSVGVNGLATLLIAFAAHGKSTLATTLAGTVAPHSRASSEARATVGNDNNPTPPTGGNRRKVCTKAAAEADIIELVGRGQVLPSQETLAGRWGVHVGTVSKWLSDFERRGLVARQRDGRRKQVAAA